MYFEGDPYNETDPFLNSAGRKRTVDKKALRPCSGIRSRLKNGVVRHRAFQRVGIARNTGRFSGAQAGAPRLGRGRLPARTSIQSFICRRFTRPPNTLEGQEVSSGTNS